MNPTSIKSKYGIDAESVISLRSNVAIIETHAAGKAIFKKARKSSSNNQINNHRFKNEMRIYRALQNASFKYLNTPKLIDAGDSHMVIQFVEKQPDSHVDVGEFVRAYLELQSLDVEPDLWFDFKNQIVRGFGYKGTIIPIFTLSKIIGISKALKVVSLFLKLTVQAPKLKHRYWLHGDLTKHNVYHNNDGQLFFIDFENLSYTRKWPLAEVIQRCIWLKDGGYGLRIDLKMLKKYFAEACPAVKHDLQKINIKTQFRFSLLMQCIQNIAIAKSKVKRESYQLFLDDILNNEKFDNWYNININPLI